MKLALTCASFEVLGGRERDCLEVAGGLAGLGHEIRIVTTRAPGRDAPVAHALDGHFEVLARCGRTNHGHLGAFARDVAAWRDSHPVDAIIGFDKIPGLDFCYVVERPRPARRGLLAILPRHRAYVAMERAVFAGARPAFAFFLAEGQAAAYRRRYAIGPDRFTILPPTLRSDRHAPASFYASRADVRRDLGVGEHAPLLVHAAVYGQQKGTDRAIAALARLPGASLLIVGLKDGPRYEALARRLGVSERVRFHGYTERIEDLIGAADLMVHPARDENTGNVIIESLLHGVPAIASEVCGYAGHVAASGAGVVLSEPFRQDELLRACKACLDPPELAVLREKARLASAGLAASPGMAGIVRIIEETVRRTIAGPARA